MHLLSIILLLPLFAAVVTLFLPDYQRKKIKYVAIFVATLEVILSIKLYTKIDFSNAAIQLLEHHQWLRLGLGSFGTWTQSQSTDVPSGYGFAKSLKMDCTTADGSPAGGDKLIFEDKASILGIFDINTNVWLWAWTSPTFTQEELKDSLDILKYSLSYDPKSNSNIHKYIKSKTRILLFNEDHEIKTDYHTKYDGKDLYTATLIPDYGSWIRFAFQKNIKLNQYKYPLKHPEEDVTIQLDKFCLLYTSPSPRDRQKSRMPSSA